MAATTITLRYEVQPTRDDWVLPEEPVPESPLHSQAVDLTQALLLHWVARTGLDALIATNLAFRWIEARPKVGLDPDVCLVEPAPPPGSKALCTWRAGHHPPRLAVEVVSEGHPYKDYALAPEKYAASGVGELWVFDPELVGPRAQGGPHRIQVWTRSSDGAFERAYAGDGPAFSPTLNAWLFAVDEGQRHRIAEDRAGSRWWSTEAEAERAAKEAERAAKEAALARIAELEAELRRRG